MARIHPINNFVLLFTLLTRILSTEGRDIKSPTIKNSPTPTDFPQTVIYDNNIPSSKLNRNMLKSSRKIDSLQVNNVGSDRQGDIPNLKTLDNYRLGAPRLSDIYLNIHSPPSSTVDSRHTPGDDRAKKDSNKPNFFFPSRSLTSSSFFGAFDMAHKNDFRPTAPGISPGAGHTDTNKNDKEESKHCLNDKCTEDFRPTAPGDSPGAGHSFVNNHSKASEQGKLVGGARTQAGQTDDYRPTAPGHSPGAGHPVSNEMRKPGS